MADDAPFCQSLECSRVNVIKIDHPTEGGVFTYLQGYKYPYQGYPDERIVDLNASYKRSLISLPELFSKSPLRYFVPLMLLLPKKMKMKFAGDLVIHFGNIYAAGFGKHQIDDIRFCVSAREILRAGKVLIEKLPEGVLKALSVKFLYSLVMAYEFDNAYRYRAQDIFGVLDIARIKENARKEILRVLTIGLKRERTFATIPKEQRQFMDVATKWELALKATSLFLLFNPFVTRILRDFFLEVDMEKIRFNEMDWYYVCGRFDYDFGGLTYAERKEQRDKEDIPFLATQPEIPAPKAQLVLVPNDAFFASTKEEAQRVVDGILAQLWEAFNKKKEAHVTT